MSAAGIPSEAQDRRGIYAAHGGGVLLAAIALAFCLQHQLAQYIFTSGEGEVVQLNLNLHNGYLIDIDLRRFYPLPPKFHIASRMPFGIGSGTPDMDEIIDIFGDQPGVPGGPAPPTDTPTLPDVPGGPVPPPGTPTPPDVPGGPVPPPGTPTPPDVPGGPTPPPGTPTPPDVPGGPIPPPGTPTPPDVPAGPTPPPGTPTPPDVPGGPTPPPGTPTPPDVPGGPTPPPDTPTPPDVPGGPMPPPDTPITPMTFIVEPVSLAFFGGGILALACLLRRRRTAAGKMECQPNGERR